MLRALEMYSEALSADSHCSLTCRVQVRDRLEGLSLRKVSTPFQEVSLMLRCLAVLLHVAAFELIPCIPAMLLCPDVAANMCANAICCWHHFAAHRFSSHRMPLRLPKGCCAQALAKNRR